MRWAFVAIMMANTLYFAWGSTRQHGVGFPDQAGGADSSLQSRQNKAALLLLGEYMSEQAPLSPAGGGASLSSPLPRRELCLMVGPFPEVVTARQVALRLENKGLNGTVNSLEFGDRSEFWAYLGPFPTRELALQVLAAVQARGQDAFIIGEGELRNAIALGIFQTRKEAEVAKEGYAAAGHVVKLAEVPRAVNQLWFLSRPGVTVAEDMSWWDDLAVEFPGIQRRHNWCDEVAHSAPIK